MLALLVPGVLMGATGSDVAVQVASMLPLVGVGQ